MTIAYRHYERLDTNAPFEERPFVFCSRFFFSRDLNHGPDSPECWQSKYSQPSRFRANCDSVFNQDKRWSKENIFK